MYGLHRMLSKTYVSMNNEDMLNKRKGDQDVIAILGGRISAGILSGTPDDLPVLDDVPDTRLKTRKTRVLVSAALHARQLAAKQERASASSKQANLDLKSGKRVLKNKILQKTNLRPGMLKARGVGQKKRKPKSSITIRHLIESNLAWADDID